MLKREIIRGIGWKRCGNYRRGRAPGGRRCFGRRLDPLGWRWRSHLCCRGFRGRRQRRGYAGESCVFRRKISALFVIPGRIVVLPSLRVVAGVEAVVRKLESFLDDERRVGPVDDVLASKAIVLQSVIE